MKHICIPIIPKWIQLYLQYLGFVERNDEQPLQTAEVQWTDGAINGEIDEFQVLQMWHFVERTFKKLENTGRGAFLQTKMF